MENEYNLVSALNMKDEKYSSCFGKFEKENKFLYDYIVANLQMEKSSGIREDVLEFIAENIEFFPKSKSKINSLYSFLCNIDITPKHWDIVFQWLLEHENDDVKDFVIAFTVAVDNEIPLDAIKELFSDKSLEFLELYERVLNYVPDKEDMDIIASGSGDLQEYPDVQQVIEEEVPDTSMMERIKVEVEPQRTNQQNGYIDMLNQFINVLSSKNREADSIHDVEDHMNKLFTQLQLVTNEMSVYFTAVIREWENDREEINRITSFCEIQRNFMMQQQNKMNDLKKENAALKEQLFSAEMALEKSEEINKKARELMEITSSVSSPAKRQPNYPYFY